jgi:hypothetical protein
VAEWTLELPGKKKEENRDGEEELKNKKENIFQIPRRTKTKEKGFSKQNPAR